MRFGAHVYLWTDRWTDQSLSVLDRARALGLDFVELPCGDDQVYDPDLTGRHARGLGLELTLSPGGVWPMDCDLSLPDPRRRQRGLDWHRRAVDLAAALGAVAYAGAIYGHPGRVERRQPTAQEYDWIAWGLHQLADYAAGAGVRVVLEPMSRFRTHLVNRPEQLVHLMGLADHPNLGILLDTYHMVTEVRDYGAAIRTAAPYLWGLHACESDRGVPGGGLVPWDQVFRALQELRFDGYVCMETYNSGPGDHAARRGVFNNPCPDGDAFVRAGLAFLRAGMR